MKELVDKKELIKIKNIYLNNKKKLIWINGIEIPFLIVNYPVRTYFDYKIKKDIFNKALLLDKYSCIIDCGAHIGDGSIPIAHALKHSGREDITVYAIDPSKNKCEFIKLMAKQNNLTNIVVINAGLSDIKTTYKANVVQGLNGGATVWSVNKDIQNECISFDILDDLVDKKIINKPIGIIHFRCRRPRRKSFKRRY